MSLMQPSNVMIFIITIPMLYYYRSVHPHFGSDQVQERVQSMLKMLKHGMMVIQEREPDISLAFDCLIDVYWIQKIHHCMCYVEFCIIGCGMVNLVNLYIVYEVI